MTNESEIREALRQKYQEKYPNALIRDEYTHGTLNTRNDLFLVDEKLIISFEIKSNGDTLKRLSIQHEEYKTYSSEVVIAIDKKHLRKFEKDYDHLIDGSTTIYIFDNNQLIEHIKGFPKKFPNVFNLLWSSELLLFRTGLKGLGANHLKKILGKSFYHSKKFINIFFNEDEIFRISKYLFTKRIKENWPTDYRRYNVSIDCDLIKNIIKSKQSKFESWSKENKEYYERN